MGKDQGFDFCCKGRLSSCGLWAKCKKYCVSLMTELWNIWNYKPFLFYLLIPFLICLITQLIYSFPVKVIIHEVLVNCGWNLMLWLLYLVYVLYVMHLSILIVHDLVFSLALWSFYPLVYKLYNQNPKKTFLVLLCFMRLCWLVLL